jgi:hypothetical protein
MTRRRGLAAQFCGDCVRSHSLRRLEADVADEHRRLRRLAPRRRGLF